MDRAVDPGGDGPRRHWDLEGAGLDAAAYRELLQSLFASTGFRTVRTSEPNVALYASNLLLVRVGKNVPADREAAVDEALFIAPSMRGGAPMRLRGEQYT